MLSSLLYNLHLMQNLPCHFLQSASLLGHALVDLSIFPYSKTCCWLQNFALTPCEIQEFCCSCFACGQQRL